MDERVRQLEEEVATLKRLVLSSSFGKDNFTSVEIVRKNWKHAGSKLGFYNGDMVAQQADFGALTDNSGGTPDTTIAAVSGSGADSTINDNFSDVTTQINSIRTILINLGLIA